jgi:hypothetical protein
MLIVALSGCATANATQTPGNPEAITSFDDLSNLARSFDHDLVACGKDLGLEPELTDDGVYLPGSLEDSQLLGQCTADLMKEPQYAPLVSPTDAVLRVNYDHSVTVHQCLVDNDFQPQIDPPDFESWLAADAKWHPHAEYADSGDMDLLARISEICPS